MRQFLLFFMLCCCTQARAATFVVDRTDDADASTCAGATSDCTLRGAINAANAASSNDDITFDSSVFGFPRQTITLDGTSLPGIINSGFLSISAPDAGVVVSGNNTSRVFLIGSGNVTLTGLTISGGNAVGNTGGGVLNFGTLFLIGCTLSDNTASGGGAVYSATDLGGIGSRRLTVRNCTLSGNKATSSAGGAIYNSTGLTVIENSTIVGNEANAGLGSGVASYYAGSNTRTEVRDSIIAGNTNSDVDVVEGAGHSFVSNGYNLIGTGNSKFSFAQSSDQTGLSVAQLKVAELADNGGPVQTIALLEGSPAINAGQGGVTTDARGVARPQAKRTDIGAFELQFTPVESLVVTTANDENNFSSDASLGTGTSLREAITFANTDGVDSAITFNIPGAGPHTIFVGASGLGALPTIGARLSIDGYSQPGSSVNTSETATNAVVRVVLDGSKAGTSYISGLKVLAPCSIQGLAIGNFTNSGISIGTATLSDNSAPNSMVRGCFLGTDATGAARPNKQNGVLVSSPNCTIGGTTPADRNLISGNTFSGILLTGNCLGSTVQGNLIGLNAAGTAAIAGGTGISVSSRGVFIGGAMQSARNVISGNAAGIAFVGSGAQSSQVQGNFIGVDASGTTAIGNSGVGISVGQQAGTISIGGGASGQGNLISGNGIGVMIGEPSVFPSTAPSVSVQGNIIGLNGAQSGALPNGTGIVIAGAAANGVIGGIGAGQGNVIARNTGDGVRLISGVGSGGQGRVFPSGNTIRGNSIYGNGGLGINLMPDGEAASTSTPNDAGDADLGPNALQNFPALQGAFIDQSGGVTRVRGTLNGEPNRAYLLDFYTNSAADASGFGEGQTLIGSFNLLMDGGGTRSFSFLVSGTDTAIFSATATNTATGNTSEFSLARQTIVVQESLVVTTAADEDDGTSDPAFGTGTSLREAIAYANSDGSASAITFDTTAFALPRKTITLNGTQLPTILPDGKLSISAPAAGVVISGDGKSRVFDIFSTNAVFVGLTIRGGNLTDGNGGGILHRGTLLLDNCTLSGNRANIGGGIYSSADPRDSTLTVRNCTFVGNTASVRGGAIYCIGRSIIENSTISDNTAPADKGSGMASLGGTQSGSTAISNTIIAGNANTDIDFVDGSDASGFRSLGYNLIGNGNATGVFSAATRDQVIGGAAPGLRDLQDNGGPTQTLALLSNSPAVDAGNTSLIVDQRGINRPFDVPGLTNASGGNASDIGAFELHSPIVDLDASSAGLDFATTFLEDGGAVAIANSDATVSLGERPLTGATITITNLKDGASESLAVDLGNSSLTSSYNAASGVLTLSGLATPTAYAQVLRTVAYNNVSQNPTPVRRFIAVTVSDGTSTSPIATSTISVNAVNDAPILDALADLTLNRNASMQTVNLTGISAGGGESQTLTITATSSDTSLIPDPTISYSSPNATGTLTFAPVAGKSGSALITVTVTDDGITDNGGLNSVTRTFTVTVSANRAPQNMSLDPTAAINVPNTMRSFVATYSDPDGADDLNLVALRVGGSSGTSNTSTNSLLCLYNATTDKLSIYDDAARVRIGNVTPGTDTVLSNSQGSLNCKNVTVSKDGNTLTVNWNVSASGAFAGTRQNIFLFARDTAGLSDGYDKVGTWTISGNARPINVSVSPVNISDAPGTERIFTTTFSDPNGYKNLSFVTLRLGGNGTGSTTNNANAMVCVYNLQNNKVYLFNDAGEYVPQADFPGRATVLSNSQGSLDCSKTTVVGSGNTLTVKWSVKAKAAFVGSRAIALVCADRGNLRDGYDTFGTWTIAASSGAPASNGLSTASASSDGITLIFTGQAPQSGYTVAVNGIAAQVMSASVKGSKVLLQLAQPLHPGDQVVVSWPGGSTWLTAS